MWKLAAVLAVAGMALIPFVQSQPQANARGQKQVLMDEQLYIVRTSLGDSCQLLTLPHETDGIRKVFPQSGCLAIEPMLDEVRFWRSAADGNIELEDSQGRALMALAATAEDNYKNLNPAYLSLTISRQNSDARQ